LKVIENNSIHEIITAISEDNLRAFTLFYDLYFQKLYDFSKYFLNSEEMCQEAVSDVFFYLWMNRKNLPEVQNIDNYLFISVKNQSLKHKKGSSKYDFESVEQMPSDFFVDVDNPEESFITDEMTSIIGKAIDSLPDRCKVIFLMVREEGLKYKEVAEILSISERTVHGQMIIAVKKIVTAIRQYFPNLSQGKALMLLLFSFGK
jgi:RNA polymerase sigma-70 factor (family 1)